MRSETSSIFQSLGLLFFDNARTFYLMRFIFGAAEAGFYPGIILYLTYWFTADERARWVGAFYSGIPLSSIIGAPISGFVLDTLDGSMGLSGWQWLFIVEGVPSIFVGFLVLRYLTDRPSEAACLCKQGWITSGKAVKRSSAISWEKLSQIPAFLVSALSHSGFSVGYTA
jgi:ACS family tartrate transporter-like MFS transporter